MRIDIHGIVIICGNYGSGKSETVVNLAASRKKDGLDVTVADLDLVNPYFRSREAFAYLKRLGVDVILPDKKYMHADLPILAPAVAGMIQQPSELTVLDAGGDDAGVTVLAALQNHLSQKHVKMLQVINPFRPFTQDINGCLRMKAEIESASKMTITGLVGNANLIDETAPDHIYKGFYFLKDVSKKTGLKIEFITAISTLFHQLDMKRFDCPVLEIHRELTVPWERKSSQRSMINGL